MDKPQLFSPKYLQASLKNEQSGPVPGKQEQLSLPKMKVSFQAKIRICKDLYTAL